MGMNQIVNIESDLSQIILVEVSRLTGRQNQEENIRWHDHNVVFSSVRILPSTQGN